MAKIAERIILDDSENKLIVKSTYDYTSALETASQLRSAGAENLGESKLIGVIPAEIIYQWAKKWGVRYDDAGAMEEVMLRELMDSDNFKFRVWEGQP